MQILMNKKGFTLIELLMVIVLIGILSLILVPNIVSLFNKNNVKSCESLRNNIISSAKIYVTNNKYELGFDCTSTAKEISLQTLVDAGDLTAPVKNPVTKEDLLNPSNGKNYKVEVIYNCTSKTFTYTFDLNCEK